MRSYMKKFGVFLALGGEEEAESQASVNEEAEK
jgi:hypothetical protein